MPAFNIVRLDTGALVCDPGTNTPTVYRDGSSAARWAVALTEAYGAKHQPRPAAETTDDTSWHAREEARFLSCEYTRLPWDEYPPCVYTSPCYDGLREGHWFYSNRSPEAKFHFVHVSVKNPGKVSYTADNVSGMADRQAPAMAIGRYLKRFYPTLTDDNIETLSAQFNALHGEWSFHLATTADEIEEVYTDGPNSCMSHSAGDYRGQMHPTRVYGDAGENGTAIAYIKRGKTVSARCLVYPAGKVYGRIYGSKNALVEALTAQGYTHDTGGGFDGAHIRRIPNENGNGYIMPYLDGDYEVRTSAKHPNRYFELTSSGGSHNCQQTNGTTADATTCPHCGEACDADEMSHIEDVGEMWCNGCAGADAWFSQYSENHFSDDTESVEVRTSRHSTENWTEEEAQDNATFCEGAGQYFGRRIYAVELLGGHTVSRHWFERHGMQCDCGSNICQPGETLNDGSEIRCTACDDNEETEQQEAA